VLPRSLPRSPLCPSIDRMLSMPQRLNLALSRLQSLHHHALAADSPSPSCCLWRIRAGTSLAKRRSSSKPKHRRHLPRLCTTTVRAGHFQSSSRTAVGTHKLQAIPGASGSFVRLNTMGKAKHRHMRQKLRPYCAPAPCRSQGWWHRTGDSSLLAALWPHSKKALGGSPTKMEFHCPPAPSSTVRCRS